MALPKAVFLLFSFAFSVKSYEIHTLESCFDSTIYLGSNDKSALNFSLGNNNYWPKYLDYKCSFKVEASNNEKIIAVIQRMSLRGHGTSCLDYIEFTDPPKLSLSDLYRMKNSKKQFCGNKNVSIMSLTNDMVLPAYNLYTLPQNVYFINGNELKVKVFISQTPLRPGETLDFQIIFTAAKTGAECRNKVDFECGNKTCIWQGFYKDGFVNCPYVRCPDEEGCEGPTIKYSSGSGTTVIICAVVSMLSVLGMFLFVLFICRRCKVLCWATRTPVTRDPSSRVHVSTSHPSEPIQPSAPPLISLHDKDLPPSYDSLFPARKSEEGDSLVMEDVIERCRSSRRFPLHEVNLVRSEHETVRFYRRKHNGNQTLNSNQTSSELVNQSRRGNSNSNQTSSELVNPSRRGNSNSNQTSSELVNQNRNRRGNANRPYHNRRRSQSNVGMRSSNRPDSNQNNAGDKQTRSQHRHRREVETPSSRHAHGRIPGSSSTSTRERTQSERTYLEERVRRGKRLTEL